MKLVEINRNPTRRDLNLFGAAWLVFFAAAGFVLWRRGAGVPLAALAWTAAATVPAVGWTAPRFMRLMYLGMSYLGLPAGWAISLILMAVVYYAVLTPIGLVMRLLKHDPLTRTFPGGAMSYWRPRQPPRDASRYFRQF
jgi:hypothetical protein